MKITLINPPQIFSQYQVSTGVSPPLGVAYLAAYCLKHAIDVQVIDAVGESPEVVMPFREDIFLRGMTFSDIAAKVERDTRLIGISNLFSFAYPAVRELVRVLRVAHPDKPVVLGGAHPTHMYTEVLTQGSADFVVTGEEGETALVELCRHLEGKIDLEQVPSVAYADSRGAIRKTAVFPRMRNLNSPDMPFPARHLLPMENYIAAQEAHGSTSGRWTSMITSRGCPYGCTFCDIRRTRWVGRSAADVVNEMESCHKEWGINEFHFEDDNMTLQRDRLIEICDEIIRRNLSVRWQTPNGIRASVTDEEMLKKMKASGCMHITLAPESGSMRVIRELMLKGNDFSHDHLLSIGRMAHRLGLKVAAYFIMGMPGERPEDVELTIRYARKLAKAGVDEAAFALLIPLPGTPIWDHVLKQYGQPDYLDLLVVGDLNRAVSWSPFLSPDLLASYRRRAYLTFQLYRALYHPYSFMRTLFNVCKGVAETKTEGQLRTFIKRVRWGWRRSDGKRSLPKPAFSTSSYTPYDDARSVTVFLKTTAHYAYSNSGLRAVSLVMRDITSWLRGRQLPKDVRSGMTSRNSNK